MRYLSIKETETSIEMFNHTLDYEIYKARKSDESLRNIPQPLHPLVGKQLYRKSTSEICIVESVNKQFHGGWYYGALLNFNGSHAFVFFENESSICGTIETSVRRFKENYEVING